MYTSPLVVDGVLYGLSPRLVAFALDAATGEELWRYDPGLEGAPQRGLMWWERGAAARLFFTGNDSLVALDPAAGRPVVDFGDDGVVDLSATFAEDGPLRVTVPGVVFEDLIVLGFSTSEAADALPGAISAYSALDGSLVWRHRNVPRPGEPGAETWAEGALEAAGGANTWTGMALDAGRGLLFAPTGSATPDFYGASRVGDNLFANSLLAIDARTGERRWHFQTIRHDVWDRDLPSPPTLVRLERGGRTIDAVAVTTKSGHLFLFERDTGAPLYDVGEVAAHPSAIPGEVVVTTQPESSIALTRQRFEMTTRSQESIDFVSAIYERLDQRPWAPPSLQGTMMYPGYDGGQEWGGSAFDPATNRLIVNSSEIGAILQLYEVPAGFSARAVYAEHCGTCHGADRAGNAVGPALTGVGERLTAREIDDVVRNGRGRMTGFAHLDEIEIRAAVRYVRNPEEEEDRPPSAAVDYAFGGYRWLRGPGRPAGQPRALGHVDVGRPGDRRLRLAGALRRLPANRRTGSRLGELRRAGGHRLGADLHRGDAGPEDPRLRHARRRGAVAGRPAGRRLLDPRGLRRGRPAVRGHRGRRRPHGPAVRLGVRRLRPAGAGGPARPVSPEPATPRPPLHTLHPPAGR